MSKQDESQKQWTAKPGNALILEILLGIFCGGDCP